MISEILRLQIQKQQSRRQCSNVLMCHSDDALRVIKKPVMKLGTTTFNYHNYNPVRSPENPQLKFYVKIDFTDIHGASLAFWYY